MRKLMTLALCLTTVAAWGQKTNIVNGKPFTKVELSGTCSATISKGACGVKVGVNKDEAMEYIEITINNGELKVTTQNMPKKVSRKLNITVSITMPTIEEIEMNGATMLNIEDDFTSEELSVEINGASHATLGNMKCQKFDLDLNGVSSINASVVCNKASVDVTGASRAMLNINADHIRGDASGVSNLVVCGETKSANFNASGVSSINISDLKHENVNKSTSGVSSVK